MRRLLLCLPLCLLLAAGRPDRPKDAPAEPRPDGDPVTFLEKCLQRYEQGGITGYTCRFIKQERIGGTLQPREKVEAVFREKPFSVFMRWVEGERKATAVVYVEGANDGQMLCRPSGLAGKLVSVVSRDPEGSDAKQSGRYSVKDFGVHKAAQRTLAAWKAARDQGSLRVEYLGVRKLREVGDRPCHTFQRTYAQPEEDGVLEGKFYIDTEKLIQIGTVLKGKDGQLHGEYFFRDVRFNPEFKSDQFQRAALTQ
jgi:hypothetical protein